LLLTLARAALSALLVGVGMCWGVLRRKRKGNRPRVAFQASAVHLAWFFELLIKRLLRDDRVDVFFVAWPQPLFPWREQRQVRELAVSRFGLRPERVLPYWKTVWSKFDLVVFVDVRAAFPLRPTRTCLLFHGAGRSLRSLERRWPGHTVYDFDLTCPFGPFDQDLIEQYRRGRLKPWGNHAVGCSQFDRYFHPDLTRAEYLRELDLTEDRPVVLYAPHYSELARPGDEVVTMFESVIRELAKLPVQLIVKLHAFSFMPAGALGRRWEPVLSGLESDRIRVDRSPDDVHALLAADVLVSDISSRAFNFMLLDKPVVLFPGRYVPPDSLARRRFDLMCQAAVVASSLADLALHVQDALRCPERQSVARRQVAQALFSNPGHATPEVVRILYEAVGLGGGPAPP
jgi:hypothetical protein